MENQNVVSIKNLNVWDWIIILCCFIYMIPEIMVTINLGMEIIFVFVLSFIPLYVLYTKLVKVYGGKITKRLRNILIYSSIFIFLFSFIQYYLKSN